MTREPKRYPLTWLKKDRDLWERMLAEMPVHQAAPDMLAALQAIVGQVKKHQASAWEFVNDRATVAAFDAARAAIAKATSP